MKEAPAVLSREGVEGRRYRAQKVLQGAGRCLSQVCFKFGERQFNRIEVGTVGRQVADAHAMGREQTVDIGDFMGGEVVEDQRIALAQLGTEHLLKIRREDIRIDGPINQKGASMLSWRKAAMKVELCQWPCGTALAQRCPIGQRP
jgi:hypothetical protein